MRSRGTGVAGKDNSGRTFVKLTELIDECLIDKRLVNFGESIIGCIGKCRAMFLP